VILSVYVVATAELHVTVAVPEFVMLLGVMFPHDRPAGIASVRDTIPLKPLMGAMVIVDVADMPELKGGGELADIVKSGVPTVICLVPERVVPMTVPVMV
jgi:hypothetical protein